MPPRARDFATVFLAALLIAGIYAALIEEPGYTDAYYYYNAGARLARGEGLTDPYLWVYLNAPDALPGPSHTYWMPLQSLVIAASLAVFGVSFGAAQLPSVLALAALVTLAAWIGWWVSGTRRCGVLAALLALFSGFYTPYWTSTDTFALYGLVGAAALAAIGWGRATSRTGWYVLAGAFSGLAHLTRADGLLLLVVALAVIAWPGTRVPPRKRAVHAAAALLAYGVVMAPWFARNLAEIGTPLPVGGVQTAWLRGYDELVNYPPGASWTNFVDWGLANILRSRWDAIVNNLGTFVAVETWIVLGPFALLGLWVRRRHPAVPGVALYALGLHLAMTLVFAYPGPRGGLFHSASALLPYWAAFGVAGLDESIAWMARHRGWKKRQARTVFSAALIVLAVALSLGILFSRRPAWNAAGADYRRIVAALPPDAVVMCNDPPGLYYHTGLGGVVVPNADPDVVPEIAARYGVTHVLLDVDRTRPFTGLFRGEEERPFLHEIRLDDAGTPAQADDLRLFEIVADDREPNPETPAE